MTEPKKGGINLGSAISAMGGVWAILPDALKSAVAAISGDVAGELRARVGDQMHKAQPAGGAIAVLPIHGVITQRESWLTMLFGGTGTDAFGAAFDEVANSTAVSAIVLDIDSPGGSVYGVAELAGKIHAARKPGRPIWAIANSLMASAAYWIGSAADKLFVTPSGEMGSIGAMSIHVDQSEALTEAGLKVTFVYAGEYKVEGNEAEPLGDEAHAEMQR
ncbi:unnamed protein product, partial [marine sediment metagenome]